MTDTNKLRRAAFDVLRALEPNLKGVLEALDNVTAYGENYVGIAEDGAGDALLGAVEEYVEALESEVEYVNTGNPYDSYWRIAKWK